jgi:hypothetical protein
VSGELVQLTFNFLGFVLNSERPEIEDQLPEYLREWACERLRGRRVQLAVQVSCLAARGKRLLPPSQARELPRQVVQRPGEARNEGVGTGRR